MSAMGSVLLSVVGYLILRREYRSERLPKITTTATLKDKKFQYLHGMSWDQADVGVARARYEITFETQNGEQKKFFVPHEIYYTIQTGDTGTLVYGECKKGKSEFIDFLKEEC